MATSTRDKMPKEPPHHRTRLQRWLNENEFTSADLERAIRSATLTGISRQSMTKIRRGADVRQSAMIRIKQGASLLAQRPVAIEELFDFDILPTARAA